MLKTAPWTLALALVAFALIFSGCAGRVDKTDPEAYTVQLVDDAIDRYEDDGLASALAYFNSAGSVDGSWYVAVSGPDDVIIAHPTVLNNIGMNLNDNAFTDASGYHFGPDVASADEAGKWVSYTYMNPETGEQESKHSWAKRRDGYLFLSGWYSDPASYTQRFVRKAIERYDEAGREATIQYLNSPASIEGPWYVFLIDEGQILIGHPTRPELRGLGIESRVDVTGYNFGEDFATATEAGKWVSYVYLNAATGSEESKHSWVVKHDGLTFGSGWYER